MKRPERSRWIAEVLDQFEGRLVRYANRLTGNLDQARDVVQETFARLCGQDPGALNGRLGPWLFAVCRNRAIEIRRKDRRMHAAGELMIEGLADEAVTPAESAEVREQSGGILQHLATLPESQQEVVRLKFQESMSYREISEVTGHSVSNVGFLLHTALKTLRERMT